MSVSYGPKKGLIINALTGDTYDVALRAALRGLDSLLLPYVIDHTLATPPGSPANGASYIVAASPTGAWVGHAGSLAVWSTDNPSAGSGEWEFYVPEHGWVVFSRNGDGQLYWDGTAWDAVSSGGGSSTLASLTDVSITSPTNGQVLTYNSGATKWENATPSGGGSAGPFCQTRKKFSIYSASPGIAPVWYFDTAVQLNVSSWNGFIDPTSNFGGSTQWKSSDGTVDHAFGIYGEPQWRTGRHIELWGAIGFPGTTDVRHSFAMADATLIGSGVSGYGSTDTPSGNFAGFRFSTIAGDTDWMAVTSDGSSITAVSCGVAPDGKEHRYAIFFDDDNSQILFYIDGALVATVTTHLPSASTNLGWYCSSCKHASGPGSGDLLTIGQIIPTADF